MTLVKNEDNIIHSKNKGRKIGAWEAINSNGKASLFLYEYNLNSQNYLKIMKESVEEMKKISNSYIIFLQIDNAKYHRTTEALQFYYENSIKVLDWSQYSPDLNPNENLWVIMKRKIRGRKFETINSLKNELHQIWYDIENRTIKTLWRSIFDKIESWLESEGKLTNY